MTRSLHHVLAILVLAISYSTPTLKAQAQRPAGDEMVLLVKGLTSDTRDAIANDLRQSGEGKLVYACVPAGILVIEYSASNGEARQHALATAKRHVAAKDIQEHGIGRQGAETRCAQARAQR
ncbi:MAG: hypothetical protein KIT10_08210 [Flavobacteriales bacterium]|nr:hypothetical protein [Flavobacteriales bacterium]